MLFADLHAHSTASDGAYAPEDLVLAQARAGVRWMSLTDHDTLDGVRPAREAGRALGVEVIPGVEVSTRFAGEEVHILAYGIEPGEASFEAMLKENREARIVRMREILRRLRRFGIEIPLEDVMHEAGGPSVGRPHLARVLLSKGVIADLEEAFQRFVGYGGPCYVPRADVWTPDAVRAIRAAGGRPVLAHPGLLRNASLVIESLLEAGLWGIEARHASHDAAARARYEETAAALGLAVTGGTDTHGPGSIHDVPLGTIEVPAETLEALLGRPVGA